MKTSVVVPVKNEEAIIGALCGSLVEQTAPPAECIVVDNNSTDNTVEVVESWRKRLSEAGTQLVVLSCMNGHQAEARSVGFGTAKHPVIISLDADVVLPNDWVRRAVELLKRNPTLVAVCGPMIYKSKIITFVHFIAFLWFRVFPSGYHFYGSHTAFRKEAYRKSGGLGGYRDVRDASWFSEAFDDVYVSVLLKQYGVVKPYYTLRAKGLYRADGKSARLKIVQRQILQSINTIRFARKVKKQLRVSVPNKS